MARSVLPTGGVAAVALFACLAAPGVATIGRAITFAQSGRSLTGQFLVATEDLRDPRFTRTVIYVIRHDARGAMGLVVNRPLRDFPLAAVLQQFGLDSRGVTGTIRVHYGGPVDPGRGFMLHTAEYAADGTERIQGDIALTQQPAVLSDIARGAGPRRALFAFGFAGWAPGQLEGEIGRGFWITAPADEALLFDTDHQRKWERAMARRRLTI